MMLVQSIFHNVLTEIRKQEGLTLLPHKAWKPACSSLIYSPKADIPDFLNTPNTPKAEILACPSRAYPRMACISAGELRVI